METLLHPSLGKLNLLSLSMAVWRSCFVVLRLGMLATDALAFICISKTWEFLMSSLYSTPTKLSCFGSLDPISWIRVYKSLFYSVLYHPLLIAEFEGLAALS